MAAGARTTLSDTIGPRIDRMIMSVHPPRNTQVLIEIVQGMTTFTETCNGDTDLVFDAIP